MSRRRIVLLLIAVLVLAAGGSAWWMTQLRPAAGAAERSQATVKYHCPMHPGMVSDKPGDCPICQMRMVPMDPQAAPSGRKKVMYRSTMNPNEVSDRPGMDSMGMEMVPVEAEEKPEVPEAPAVPGLTTVRIPVQKQQLIGVKTFVVEKAPFVRTIRAVGRVTTDETRLHHLHAKVSGYLETLHANATGELVRKGQPLIELYSPELLASQQEYIVALRARERTAGSSLSGVAASGEELVASARRRLELFDVSEAQIQELERTGQPRRTVTLYAPMSGYITSRNVTHGEKIEPETSLLDLADLSRVWVLAAVYEYELPFVRQGQKATMTLSYLPGRAFEGRVSLVYPVLDPATRTAQVRVEFPNPDLILKPEMYADVALSADLGRRLSVPSSAVMETGTRSVVFVDRGEGLFEPREVTIGLRLSDASEVLAGLREGESVLTSGNFFVDSESKLKAALEDMAQPPPAPVPAPPAVPSGKP